MKLKNKFMLTNIKPLVFMTSNIMLFIFAFVFNLIMINYSNGGEYGKYKYATNFVLTIPALFGLGINHSCGRLVALKKIDQNREIVGISFVVSTVISIVVTLTLFISISVSDSIRIYFEDGIGVVIPFIIVYMLKSVVYSIYQGSGEIYKLSFFNILPYIIMIGTALITIQIKGSLNYYNSIFIFLIANTVIIIPRVIRTRSSFHNLKENLHELYIENKVNGFKVYLSSIFTTSSTQVIALVTGSLVGFVEYGYYALAYSLSGAFRTISSSFAIARFRDNINNSKINKKELLGLVIVNAFIYIMFYALIGKIFYWFYPKSYAMTISYLKLLVIMNICYGISDYFNKFLIGKQMGGKITKISMITGIVNITFSSIFIYFYGIIGLAIAGVLVAIINLSMYFLAYLRYLRSINDEEKDKKVIEYV